MTQPLQLALTQIAVVIGNVNGIKKSFAYPREQNNEYPFASIYPANGNMVASAIGTRKTLHDIYIDVIKDRLDIGKDLETLAQFLDTVPEALIREISTNNDGIVGNRFDNTISTMGQIDYVFVPMLEYSKIPCIAYRFMMRQVKILSET